MRRYERIEEIKEQLDQKCGYSNMTVLRDHMTPSDMIDIDHVRKECEKRNEASKLLHEVLNDLKELKELTGIEASLKEGNCSSFSMNVDLNYIYSVYLPRRYHLEAIKTIEVGVSDPEQVREKQKEKWDNLASIKKFEMIIKYLESDPSLTDQITFLEEEIGE